eukprot:1194611-Prorocentrum_minimum.AAC.6
MVVPNEATLVAEVGAQHVHMASAMGPAAPVAVPALKLPSGAVPVVAPTMSVARCMVDQREVGLHLSTQHSPR